MLIIQANRIVVYLEPIAKVVFGGFAGAEVLKNSSLSGVEGKH